MTSYILVAHRAPWSFQSVSTLVDFARTAACAEHTVKAIFLYQDAVLNALPQLDIPSDEMNGQLLLKQISLELNIPILLCVTAAEKRGVSVEQVAEGFKIAGLAEFAELAAEADKVVQFK